MQWTARTKHSNTVNHSNTSSKISKVCVVLPKYFECFISWVQVLLIDFNMLKLIIKPLNFLPNTILIFRAVLPIFKQQEGK